MRMALALLFVANLAAAIWMSMLPSRSPTRLSHEILAVDYPGATVEHKLQVDTGRAFETGFNDLAHAKRISVTLLHMNAAACFLVVVVLTALKRSGEKATAEGGCAT